MTNLTKLEKRYSRKKKIAIWMVFTPVLLIASIFMYAYFQFKSAYESSSVNSLDRKELEFNPVKSLNEKYNVLLLGTDARNEENSRTDTIMIAQYDEKTKNTKIISIMRDTYVEIPDYGYHKINAAYAFGGVETLRETLKLNFDVDVHFYAIVDFTSFPKVVDVVFPDGVEIEIENQMSKGIDSTLHAGTQILNGTQLLDYVRFRKDEESDFGRVRRQQEVLKLLGNEFSKINNIVKFPKVLGAIMPHIHTNLDSSLIYSLGHSILLEKELKLESMRVPVDGSYTDERYEHAGLVLAINIVENQHAIKNFLNEQE